MIGEDKSSTATNEQSKPKWWERGIIDGSNLNMVCVSVFFDVCADAIKKEKHNIYEVIPKMYPLAFSLGEEEKKSHQFSILFKPSILPLTGHREILWVHFFIR